MKFHQVLHSETGLLEDSRYPNFKYRELKKNTEDCMQPTSELNEF